MKNTEDIFLSKGDYAERRFNDCANPSTHGPMKGLAQFVRFLILSLFYSERSASLYEVYKFVKRQRAPRALIAQRGRNTSGEYFYRSLRCLQLTSSNCDNWWLYDFHMVLTCRTQLCGRVWMSCCTKIFCASHKNVSSVFSLYDCALES